MKQFFLEGESLTLILAYYSRSIALYNTIIQYKNNSKDLQKAGQK